MGELINITGLLSDAQIPPLIARDMEMEEAFAKHKAEVNPHSQYLTKNPTSMEWGHAEVNVMDFHGGTGSPTIDFDVRILASNGISQNGKGHLSIQAALFSLISNLSINGGVQIARFLMAATYIDLPPISAGGVYDIYMSIPGAIPGDIAWFLPTTNLYNGLWAFHIQAAITANNVAQIYFKNGFTSSLDISAFSGKLLVIGFA
jgi:hypothetical protein